MVGLQTLVPLCLFRVFLSQSSSLVFSHFPQASFPSLAEAFLQTEEIAEVTLQLAPSAESFDIVTAVDIKHQVTVLGEGQRLRLGALLALQEMGSLALVNLTILPMSEVQMESGFEVRGSLTLRNSTVQAFSMPLMRLSGLAILSGVDITGSTAVVIAASAPFALTLSWVLVSGLSVFLTLSPSTSPFTISISESRFESNARLLFSVAGPGLMTVTSSTFARNSGVLFQASGFGLHLEVMNSLFIENQNSLLLISQLGNSTLSLKTCSFTGNTGISFSIVDFQGSFLFQDSVLRQQHGRGPVHVENSLLHEGLCEAHFLHSRFVDIHLSQSANVQGSLLYFASCPARFSNVTFSNATVLAPVQSKTNGLISARLCLLALTNLTVRDSGSAGTTILVTLGHLYLSNFALFNPGSGQAIFVMGVGGSAVIENGAITQGTVYSLGVERFFGYKAIYFGVVAAEVKITNVTISDSAIEMGMVLGVIWSTYLVGNIHVSDLTISSLVSSVHSRGELFNISADGIEGDMHVFQGGYEVATYTNITLSNYHQWFPNGVIKFGNSHLVVTNVVYSDSSARDLFGFTHASLVARNIQVTRCVLDRVSSFVDCQATLHSVHIAEHQGSVLTVVDSTVSVAESAWVGVTSRLPILQCDNGNLVLESVVMRNLALATGVGRLSIGKWQMERCVFDNVSAEGKEGWDISDGTFTIANSLFREFVFGLFHCRGANVTFVHSEFSQGHNPVKSLKSRQAYGAVLGCVDCPLSQYRSANSSTSLLL